MYHAISESGTKICADWASFLAPAFGLNLRPGRYRRHGARRCIIVVLGRRGRLHLLIATGNRGRGLLGVLGGVGAIRAMPGRKLPIPSRGLAIQVDTELHVVDASRCLECLVKELVCPRLDIGPKEGSNGHQGSEVRYKVPGHKWHFWQFDSRFQMGKEALKRADEEALHVVQGGHVESPMHCQDSK